MVRRGESLKCEECLDIGDWWSGVWRGKSGVYVRRGLQRMACQPLSIYDLPFVASIGFQFFCVAQRNIQPICHPLFYALTERANGLYQLRLPSSPAASSLCSSACSKALCSAELRYYYGQQHAQ